MHIFQSSLVTNLANATIIGFCVLGIGFMLRFLLALKKEQKTSLAGFRLEYRIDSSLTNAATRQAPRSFSGQPPTQPDRSEREYDRGEFFSRTPQALFTESPWQEPNRT